MKYLFLCHAGAKRSPTACSVAGELARRRGLHIEMDYGSAYALYGLGKDKAKSRLAEYDKVFAMTEDICERLAQMGLDMTNVCCLDIEDVHERHDPALRALLRDRLKDLL